MAEKTVYVDDLDGTNGTDVKPVLFALDGREYMIDLSEKNHEELCDALVPFIESARRVRKGATRVRKGGATTSNLSKSERSNIREWGQKNGYSVGERGRISQELVDAYNTAAPVAGKKSGKKKIAKKPDPAADAEPASSESVGETPESETELVSA